jgi:hypothetical protein
MAASQLHEAYQLISYDLIILAIGLQQHIDYEGEETKANGTWQE